jgi:LPS sulfotransferase NodH
MSLRSLALSRFSQLHRLRAAPASSKANLSRVHSPRPTSDIATYIICTNPRSGSWLLSDGLASTSLAGNPHEWFNLFEEQEQRAHWRMDHATDLTYSAYLQQVRVKSTTRNGISGIKLHYQQFAALRKKLAVLGNSRTEATSKLMSRAFPNVRYLWLIRSDKARQAISYRIADKTNQWWAIEGVKRNDPTKSSGEVEFDAHAIASLEQALTGNDAKWQSYFQDNKIVPFVVHYEDLVSDYRGTIASVLKWLGIPNTDAIHILPSRLKRQSNARNEDWLARYTEFKSEGGHLGLPSTPVETGSPLFARSQRAFSEIPNAWKRWIAHSKILGMTDDTIIEVLTNNGYHRVAVLAEVEKAASDAYLAAAVRNHQRYTKPLSLLNTSGQLARLNSKAKVVERRSNLSRDEFRDQYYAANRPVVLQGLMTGWRAMTAWTPEYLKAVAGEGMVEVMTGRNDDPKYEMNGRKHRTEMRFADYVDLVYSGKTTNDYYMVANNAFFQRTQMQPLLKDVTAFPQYLTPVTAGKQCFLWFGPAGTLTPLHHDTSNILIAQVVGRKRYRIIPASQWQYVYNTSSVFSDVDCENPDLSRHPKFRNATIIDMVLEPGEVLFMPVGWWHQVRALDVSMTVSFTNFVFSNYFTWEP